MLFVKERNSKSSVSTTCIISMAQMAFPVPCVKTASVGHRMRDTCLRNSPISVPHAVLAISYITLVPHGFTVLHAIEFIN